jgi:acyl carrier protein
MRSKPVADRVRGVVARVIGAAIDTIDDDSGPDTVPGWDSFSHIDLALSLEVEFGISFTPEELMDLVSVRIIKLVLQDKGVAVE